MSETRERIKRAFRALRGKGYFARIGWQCCTSCGVAALPEGTERYAFCHRQDDEGINSDAGAYVAWGGDPLEIIHALSSEGLETEHDGTPTMKIFASLPLRETPDETLKLGVARALGCTTRYLDRLLEQPGTLRALVGQVTDDEEFVRHLDELIDREI